MGEACCTHGEDEKFLSILVRKPEIKGMAHSRDLNISGKTILKLISNRARICAYSEFKQLRMDVELVAHRCDHEK